MADSLAPFGEISQCVSFSSPDGSSLTGALACNRGAASPPRQDHAKMKPALGRGFLARVAGERRSPGVVTGPTGNNGCLSEAALALATARAQNNRHGED